MALEDVMERLIGALNANTEAHGGKATPGKVAPGKPAAGKAATVTFEQVKAALVGVKDAHGKKEAQDIIRSAGNAAEMSAIKPARFTAVIAACEERMGEGDGTEDVSADDEL